MLLGRYGAIGITQRALSDDRVFDFDLFSSLVDDDFRGPNPGGWRLGLLHHHFAERRHDLLTVIYIRG